MNRISIAVVAYLLTGHGIALECRLLDKTFADPGVSLISTLAALTGFFAALYAWLLFAGPAERDVEMQRRSHGRG